MVKAVFSPQNKLVRLDLSYDVMSFIQQLRRASGRYDFQIVPNTLSLAKDASSDARMIIEYARPHRIVHVNETWCELIGYTPDQVINKNMDILFGQATETDKLDYLATQIAYSRPVMLTLTNYTADGRRVKSSLRFFPLYSDKDLTHFMVVMEFIQERRQPVVRKMIEKEEVAASISSDYSNSGKSTSASYSSSSISNTSSSTSVYAYTNDSESQSVMGHHYIDHTLIEELIDEKAISIVPQWKLSSPVSSLLFQFF
jgi:PAS domain S-box-containing protein